MSVVTNLSSYKSLKELRSFAETQQLVITKLMADLKAKEADIEHLKKMLVALESSNVKIFENAPSQEELICIEQIGKLRQLSGERPFTNKEVDSLEKLVRTLKSIRKPEKKEEREALPILTKSELLAIAAADSEDNTDV